MNNFRLNPDRAMIATALLCGWMALSSIAFAQQTPPAGPSEKQKENADVSTEKPKDTGEQDHSAGDQQKPPASLDDLLGIEKEKQEQGAGEAAAKDADDELKRKLNEAEIADSFALAVEKMSLSAELLDVKFDPGLGTQRVQEDILSRLDFLIDQAKKNQSQSRSSSSSASAQPQNRSQQNPGQQKSNAQNTGDKRNNKPSDSREGDPPPLQEGNMNTVMEESRTEWGNLPPRVRDQLLQGRKEKFSSLYEQLTQEYYKRLAEESVP